MFEWDKIKAAINIKKHGVSFEETTTVFEDCNSILMEDSEHSDEEERFNILGMCIRMRALVVCHCYRDYENIIRIISARKASKREERLYIRGIENAKRI